MNLNEIVAKFIECPSYLDNGAGLLSLKWGVDKREIKEAKSIARLKLVVIEKYPEKVLVKDKVLTETKVDVDLGETKHTLLFDRPLTKEELEAHFYVDNINTKITNYWSILVKSGEGYATSVNIKNISKEFNPYKAEEIFNNFKEKSYDAEFIRVGLEEEIWGENLLVLNIADFHLDKLEIGVNDVEVKILGYVKCIKEILDKASLHKINRILYVVGNDYFNTDNIQGGTTKGTPQEVSMTWEKAYEIGFELQVLVFNTLLSYSPNVDILHVSGNHDETKSYYLAYALSRYFEKSGITFMINTHPKKVYLYGETFFGFHHGNTTTNKLPLNFSKEFSEEWGLCSFHDIITGDKHHYKQEDIEGIRMHQMPSLSGVDTWHNNKLYNNSIKSGLGMLYNYKKGKFAEFEIRI